MIDLRYDNDVTQNVRLRKSAPRTYTYDSTSTCTYTYVIHTTVDYCDLREVGVWPSRDPIGEFAFRLLDANNRRQCSDGTCSSSFVRSRSAEAMSRVITLLAAELRFHQPYGFVRNDPILRIDILGLADCECPAGSNEGRRQRDGFDSDTVVDNQCTSPFGDIVFTSACQKHDQCYATCNNDKAGCDLSFYLNMQTDCSTSCGTSVTCLTACYVDANAYYSAVVLFGDTFIAGDQSYSTLQDAACEDCCCP